MLHNKYFEVLRQFAGGYTSELYGRSLIGKVKLSQKGIALALEELEKQSVLKSRMEGTSKLYSLNLQHSEIKDILAMVELMSKMLFMSKHRKIAHLFRSDSRIVGIFGSYAKGAEKKESDIDLFILGKKMKGDYDTKGKAYDLDISTKHFAIGEWTKLLKSKNNLCREIIGHHVLISGVEGFISSVWRNYYGFD